MVHQRDKLQSLPSTILASVLTWARQIQREFSLDESSPSEFCQVTETSPSQAFEMLVRLKEAARHLLKSPGPRPLRETVSFDDIGELSRATIDFLMDTPGAVSGGPSRRTYHESLRQFVLGQMSTGRAGSRLGVELVAEVVRVPLGTLKSWIAHPAVSQSGESPVEPAPFLQPGGDPEEEPTLEFTDPNLATILREFKGWKGTFSDYCNHLQEQHRIVLGKTHISSILEMAGLRIPRRRGSTDRPWSDGTYERFFPGAQWVGDGKSLVIEWNGTPMSFNMEAIIDPASDALVGLIITDTENEEAVLKTYYHGIGTTDHKPMALTLDNRESNHTDYIKTEISPTQLLASTPAAPTSKAPIEGAFGLFSQVAPPLLVEGESPRELAKSVLQLVGTLWAWSRNHKPRHRLGNKTPAQVHQEAKPSLEDIEKVKEHILRLERNQEEYRKSREARSDPVRLQLLRENLADLGIENADALSIQLAIYSREAILRGLATFRTKKREDTLPKGGNLGRYLGGIIRNIHARLEDEDIAQQLLDLRIRCRDLSLIALTEKLEELSENASTYELPQLLVEQALEARPLLDYRFWRQHALMAITDLPVLVAGSVYRYIVRKITKSFATPWDRRSDLAASLSAFITLAVS